MVRVRTSRSDGSGGPGRVKARRAELRKEHGGATTANVHGVITRRSY